MNNMMQMGNINNIPTPQELWKNEKSKYRHWFILFGIAIIAILGLYLTATILNTVGKESIIDNQLVEAQKTNADAERSALENTYNVQFIILPFLIVGAIFVGLILYFISIFESYSNKSFSKISEWPLNVMSLGAFLSFVQIIMSLFYSKTSFSEPGAIFQFVNQFLFIAVYVTVLKPVKNIKRMFLFAEKAVEIRKNPQLMQQMQAFQNLMQSGMNAQGGAQGQQGGKNPYGPAPTTHVPPVNGTAAPVNGIAPAIGAPVIDPEKDALENMDIDKLRKVAKKLSISGAAKMRRDEIIEAIIRVTGK